MNNFELFSLIFLLLDERWEDYKEDEDLGHFLSEMNPYLWDDIGSADPAVYSEFLDFMKEKTIGEDLGYSLVNPYLDTIEFYPNLKRYLSDVDKDTWIDAVHQLLSQPHKGDSQQSEQPK